MIFAAKDGATMVELTHRDWDILADRAAELRERYDGGWDLVLAAFMTACE